MNIQIFGDNKSFDSKKAERYFKERRIKYQYIDLRQKDMSKGELQSVRSAVGLDALINKNDPEYALIQYLSSDEARFQKLLECQYYLNVPIVRNGKAATVGYCPEVWKTWE